MRPLTKRQHAYLQRLAQGMTGKQIAADLGISHSTVRSGLSAAYARLGVADGIQAVAVMLRREEGRDDGTYTTTMQRWRARDEDWLPTPAQRLYLDAFDELLRTRTAEAARVVNFYFVAMCQERGCPDRREGREDIDSVLLGIARGVTRLIPEPELEADG